MGNIQGRGDFKNKQRGCKDFLCIFEKERPFCNFNFNERHLSCSIHLLNLQKNCNGKLICVLTVT